MIGLTDRIRLRPLVAGATATVLYLSSEEAAIRLIWTAPWRTSGPPRAASPSSVELKEDADR